MKTTTTKQRVREVLGGILIITALVALVPMLIASPLSFSDAFRLGYFGVLEAMWGFYGIFILAPPAVFVAGALTIFKSAH